MLKSLSSELLEMPIILRRDTWDIRKLKETYGLTIRHSRFAGSPTILNYLNYKGSYYRRFRYGMKFQNMQEPISHTESHTANKKEATQIT